MGKPGTRRVSLPSEKNKVVKVIRGEVKHLSNRRRRKRIDSVSSGERKRNSPNCLDLSEQGSRTTMWK